VRYPVALDNFRIVEKQRTKRLSTELADNYVDETLEAYDVDETPER
jgi:hypothetical protein